MSEEIKHSPTPWTLTSHASVESQDGGAFQLVGLCPFAQDEANAAHIVKCVNLHEELVKALKEAISLAEAVDFEQNDVLKFIFEECQTTLIKAAQ